MRQSEVIEIGKINMIIYSYVIFVKYLRFFLRNEIYYVTEVRNADVTIMFL